MLDPSIRLEVPRNHNASVLLEISKSYGESWVPQLSIFIPRHYGVASRCSPDMNVVSLCLFASAIGSAFAAGVERGQIKNLVTFGDSYTDIVSVGDGGVAWPVYAAGYAGVSLFPFARSGATCSNDLTPRPFPSVFESQLPLYFNQSLNGTLSLNPEETVYSLWIGTNDLGANALITGQPKASIVDVAQCMVNWVKVLYDSGARNFIFQNVSGMLHRIDMSNDSFSDDTSGASTDVFAERLPNQVLGRPQEQHGVECLHEGACAFRKCFDETHVGIRRAQSRGFAHW